MDAAARTAEQRQARRTPATFRVHGFGPDARAAAFDVLDLSALGMRVRTAARLHPGDRLRLRVPAIGAVAAEVRWVANGEMGCAFDDAIDRASYFELLAASVA